MVRRTAEIFIFDADDYESMFAKYGINGIWDEKQLKQHKNVSKILEELNIKPEWFDGLTSETEKLVKNNKYIAELMEERVQEDAPLSDSELNENINKVNELMEENAKLKNRREGLDHRRMSNNSIGFIEKPKEEILDLVFEMMQMEGEPKHIWAR